MKVYAGETVRGENIIILNKEESRELLDAFEVACDAEYRKKKRKKMKEQLEKELFCF